MVVMLSAYLKPAVTRAINPIARGALRIGVTPNAVTFVGAVATTGVAAVNVTPAAVTDLAHQINTESASRGALTIVVSDHMSDNDIHHSEEDIIQLVRRELMNQAKASAAPAAPSAPAPDGTYLARGIEQVAALDLDELKELAKQNNFDTTSIADQTDVGLWRQYVTACFNTAKA